MAATDVHSTSKSAKKKTPKPVERADSPAPSATSGPADKHDEVAESPYIKELQKNIRNVNKKIANASKIDSLLAQHSGKSIDDLVASKVINADQKAQILKKPGLQAQLTQFEEQLSQYQKVHEQYRAQAVADKSQWEKSIPQIKAEAVNEAKQAFQRSLNDNFLVLSQFLRLAAYSREEAKDPESDESQAIEGVLLAIYSGDESAVSSMLKLVGGTDDQILSVPGEVLQTTYSDVKSLAQEYKTPFYPEAGQSTEAETIQEAVSDPTVAHATINEIESGDAVAPEPSAPEAVSNGMANANVSDEAANAVAESHWDNNKMSISQEWVDVKVPRDPAETDTGLEATPAAGKNTQSWADDQPEPTPQVAKAPSPANEANDGFHQVQRNRVRHEREGSGNWRGRGRGDYRGRGNHRGDGRGRGRGGNRGGSGVPNRGPRRNEES